MNQSWRRFKPSWFVLPKNLREVSTWLYQQKIILIIILLVFVIGYFGSRYYNNHTNIVPAVGGTLTEGLAGQPDFINPILSQTNDIDRDLVQLIFSAPLTYDTNHQLIGNLVDKWDISEDGKVYTIYLKDNLQWHDGQPLTADDVVFTYQLIQNQNYPGTLHDNWRDVSIEKVDDKTIKFSLPSVFSPFLTNLTTGIIPQHIFSQVDPAKLMETDYNLEPIGSGPFKVKKIVVDKNGQYNSIELTKFDQYYDQKPYLDSIVFKFYDTYQAVYTAYQKKEIISIGHVLTTDWPQVSAQTTTANYYDIPLPQYTAIFLNQNSKTLLRDPYIKEALYYGLNREQILNDVIFGKGEIINTPILSGFMGNNPDIPNLPYDVEKAKGILEKGKWVDVDGDGVREKDNVRLGFSLVTSDTPDFMRTAKMIQNDWRAIGVDLQIGIYNIGDLESQFIKSRNYDALLFGENLGSDPDPYVYWHSSQISDPGLNLSSYANVEVDRYIEAARQTNDNESRIHSYLPMQVALFDEKPAVFLFRPYYIYAVNKAVLGINVQQAANPAERFLGISDWYINTKREWKK